MSSLTLPSHCHYSLRRHINISLLSVSSSFLPSFHDIMSIFHWSFTPLAGHQYVIGYAMLTDAASVDELFSHAMPSHYAIDERWHMPLILMPALLILLLYCCMLIIVTMPFWSLLNTLSLSAGFRHEVLKVYCFVSLNTAFVEAASADWLLAAFISWDADCWLSGLSAIGCFLGATLA